MKSGYPALPRSMATRWPNMSGPRIRPDDGWIVSSFIVQALRGEPLTVRSGCFGGDSPGATGGRRRAHPGRPHLR
jgi:hypothetical protein